MKHALFEKLFSGCHLFLMKAAVVLFFVTMTLFGAVNCYAENGSSIKKVKEMIESGKRSIDEDDPAYTALFTRAMREAVKGDDDEAKAYVLLEFSDFLLKHGYYESSAYVLSYARQLVPGVGRGAEAKLAEQSGFASEGLKNDSAAELYYKKALSLYKEEQDLHGMTLTLLNMGVMAHRYQNTAKARNYYSSGVNMLRQERDSFRLANALAYFGLLQDSEAARDSLLTKAQGIAITTDNKPALFQIYYYQARIAFDQARYKDAETLIERAMRYQQAMAADNEQRYAPLLLQSKIYAVQKEPAAAYEVLQQYLSEISGVQALREKVAQKRFAEAVALVEACGGFGGEKESWSPLWLWITTGVLAAALAAVVAFALRSRRGCASREAEMSERLSEYMEKNLRLTENYGKLSEELLRHTMGFMHHCAFLNQMARELRAANNTDKAKMQAVSKSVVASLSQYTDSVESLSGKDIMRCALETLGNRMKEDEPSLTPETLDLAMWIRLGFPKRDIMTATGKKSETLQMTRYRLRKALNLAQNQNLYEYLKNRWPDLPEVLRYGDRNNVDIY